MQQLSTFLRAASDRCNPKTPVRAWMPPAPATVAMTTQRPVKHFFVSHFPGARGVIDPRGSEKQPHRTTPQRSRRSGQCTSQGSARLIRVRHSRTSTFMLLLAKAIRMVGTRWLKHTIHGTTFRVRLTKLAVEEYPRILREVGCTTTSSTRHVGPTITLIQCPKTGTPNS